MKRSIDVLPFGFKIQFPSNPKYLMIKFILKMILYQINQSLKQNKFFNLVIIKLQQRTQYLNLVANEM